MAKPKARKYLVVVEHIPRQAVPLGTGMTYSIVNQPTIRVHTVDAADPHEAADKAGVPAGATARVAALDDVSTFKRPSTAPLVAA